MKKHLQKFLLLVAFLMPWAVNAQVQLTVANGTVTNEYVPIYGYYGDAYLRAQMIYPGSDLSAMTGDTITSMTFYANAFADWGSVTFQVKVGTTAASTLSDWSTETLTTVYNGVPSMNSSNQMVITFTTPYTYTGGNLLVEFVSTSTDDYDHSYWYGITSTGSSVQGYDYDDVSYAYADQQDFLPKVTFTYAPSSQSCPMPFGLTASNITLSSADITWRDTANAGAYRLYWAPADTLSLIDSVDVYDTAYSITGLYEYENYVVKVKSLCTTEESFLTQITFQTLSTVLHYNMTASFDSIRTCNAVIYDNGGPNGSYANNSNNTLVIRSNSPDSALILSGTYVGEGCCDYLSIYEGVGTNGTRLHYGSSPSSGTVVNIGPLISEMGFTIVFTSDGSVNNGGYELSVNCFSNSCPRSSNFHAVAVSSDEVTLGWTPGINDIQWTIDTNGVSNDFYDSTATFYNLTPNTNYTFTLRGVCGVDDTSLAVTLTLRTPCVALDSLPYTQDFEAATTGGSQSATFVNCMTRLNNGSSYYGWPYVSSTASYNHTTGGAKGLYWYNCTTTNTYGDYQVVVLPGVDTDMYAMNTLQLNFWAKATSTSYSPVFQVGVMTNPNDISTFQLVQTVNVGNSGQWNIFEIPFSSFTGNGQFVAIRANRPTSSWYACVDDITLMEIPACPHVANLRVDSMSVDWAAIGWTEVGTASSWYVEYDTVQFTPGTGNAAFTDVAYDTTYLLNYLDTGRTYYVYVAADCNGDPSPWESLTLTTLASLPATMPYSCTFEGSGTNGWDFINGSQTNHWMVGTATNNGGTKSMYITNNGTANAYTVGSQSIVYATRIFNLADTGEYLYSYDWKAYGESNYDYIRAWLAPATATLTAGQLPDGSTSPYNYTSTTPTGWISLDGGTKLNLQSSWQNRTSTFQLNQVGAYQLVFMWANDGSGGSTPPAAIDNIQFIRNSCPQPTGITVTGVTDNSISLSWHAGGSESSWSVFDGTNYYISTDTNYTLMGLNSDVTYNISVRALCDDGDSSLAILASARTLMTCPRPINFVVTHVWGDTVSLTWRDTTNASSFDLVYGQTGFDPDTVVSNFVYGVIDSNYTFTGLTIGQPYQFYVRTNCASDDSRWEGPVSAVPGYVMSMAATGTRTIHNACGYTIYDDGGATGDYSTNCNSTLTLYPDTGYILRMYGTCNTENNYDYLRIYDGPDANSTMVFESSGTNTIDTITATRGPLTIVFTSDNSVVYPGFELHTICEPAPDCGQVVDLAVTAGPASAMVTWSPSVNDINTYSGAVVEYKEASDTTWTTLNTTGTSIAISGLTANTVYDLRVSTECSGSTSSWLTDQFTTRGYGCAEVSGTAIDTIGTGTATSNYIPSYGFYNYSLSQQIFTAAEITGSGNITSIAVMPSAVASQRTYEIYLAHTTQTSLSGFIHPSDMVRVYDGAPNTMTANQWVTFNFDTPFNYNGTDNLLVCFRDITGSYASGTSWYVHSSTGNSVYTYSDDGAFDPFTTTGGTTVASRNNIIITAEACARLSTCAAPPTLVENVTPTSVDLVWAAAGTESSWSIYVMGENDTVYTFLDTTTLTSYQVTGLTPAFQYRFKIMANCGTDSSATVVDATTACAPVALPYTENFENYGGVYDRMCWTIGTTNLGTEAPYPLVVNLTGDPNKLCLFYNGAYAVMPRMGAPLNQLQIRFNFTQGGDDVRFLMGLMDDPLAPIDSLRVLDTIIRSQYDTVNSTIGYTYRFNQLSESDTAAYIAFWDAFNDNYSFIDDLVVEYIPNCLPVTGVTVSNVTTTSATVNWVDNDNFSASYIVEYGPHGFVPGTGTVDSAATMPYTLTGLTHSTRYDVYVYAICGADTATASPVVNFTTQCDAVTVLPYFTNFEGYVSPGSTATNVLPNCWSTEATNAYIYYNTNTSQAPSPSYALQLMGNGLVALPEMGVPLDSLMVTFHDYKAAGLGLIVGAINTTAPGSLSGQFVPVDTILFANGVTQTTVTSYLTDYSGTGTRIAIKAFGNTGTGVSHYIDNLTIDRISGCIAPQHVQCAQLTGTSADIVWRISQASNYSVEYGVHGFTPGAGTTVTTATRSVSLTGLTPQTQYDVRIVALCGADTSDTVLFTFTTACDYVTIPYLQTFEAATTGSSTSATFVSCMTRLNNGTSYYGYPYVGGSTYNHTSGGSKGLYWYNTTTTGTYGDYQCVVLPPVNPTMGVDTLQLSFWAKASSASYTPVFQVGVMTDPTNIATFVGVDTISLTSGTTWTLVEVPLTTYTGNGLYVAIKADRPASSWYAYVDDISLDIAPSCISPRNIFATAASSTSLTIDWVEATPATNWQVEYGPANYTLGSATGTLISTTTHPVTVTGLDTLTSYDFYVRPICSATDTGAWSSSARFTTAMCDNAEIAAIGSESSSGTSYYYPVNNYFRYTLSETIIDSAELGGPMDISFIGYYYNYSSAMSAKTNCTIYFQPTTRSTFGTSSDIVTVDTSIAVKVYEGAFNFSQGWNFLPLDTVYSYSGHGNLMVIVDDNSNDYNSSSHVFKTASCTGNKTLVYYSDSYDPDAFTVTSSYSGTKAVYTSRVVMQLVNCGSAACRVPAITSTTTTYQSGTVNWAGNGTAYEVAYKTTAAANWSAEIPVTTHSYTFTGLQPSTVYMFRVRQNCTADSLGYSNWATGSFVTDSLPCLPPDSLTVLGTTNATATFGWTARGNETAWDIRVFNTSIDTIYTVTTNPATVSGLTAGVTYYAAIRALCGNAQNIPGDWSDSIQFATQVCPTVTGVTSSNVTFNSVTLNWTAAALAQGYEVEYGMTGFTQGNGTRVTTTTNSITVNGLMDETGYQFFVRAVCGTNWQSENWSTPVTVTTGSIVGTTYNITTTVNPTNAGSVTGSGLYSEGDTATLTATANTGYTFSRWNDNVTANPRSVIVTSDSNFTAFFTRNQYTVTVTSADQTRGTVTGNGTYYYGDTATLTATAAAGYHFTQWNDGDTHATRSIVVTRDTTFTASFGVNQYTVTATANDASMGTVTGGGQYNFRDTATLTATARTGFYFQRWNDGNVDNPRTFVVTGDVSLTAIFVSDSVPPVQNYTVTLHANDDNMGIVNGAGTFAEGTSVEISAIANAGYRFVNWNDGVTDNPRTFVLTCDTTFTANFAEQVDSSAVLVVSFDGEMGYVLINGNEAGSYNGTLGDEVSLRAVAYDGYHFVEWSDGETAAERTIVLEQSRTTLTATFAIGSGIATVENSASCLIYPNPATSSTTISVSGVNGKVRIAVVDINGRVVKSEEVSTFNSQLSTTVDVDNLSQGAYFVRITGEKVNMVKKLIVR